MSSFSRLIALVLLFASVRTPAEKAGPPPITHFMGREIAQTMHYSGAEWLIRQTRESEEASSELLRLLGVKPGMTVCDLGCGNGYHTIPIAKHVGAEGKVYGVDIQPEMLEMLKERAAGDGVANIVPVLGDLDNPNLPDEAMDLVLLVDVYHEFSHPLEMMKAIHKNLKPEGRIALVEFRTEDPKVPIKPEHKMSKNQILKELPLGGFELVDQYDGLPWQHLMWFKRADEGTIADKECRRVTRSKVLQDFGNRLTFLDEEDPYYVSRFFPKLTTPQWIGEEGVEAAVILSIDDLGDPQKYESYLRPILERLKQIDGRAPLSITTNKVDPNHPKLQTWLAEGLSLDAHTTAHKCPMMTGGDLAAVKEDYDRCVDLLASIPGNRPTAFRVPCCDSMNATSPRFFTEVFNKTTPNGNFATMSSSVFHLFTPDDPDLPRELVEDDNGVGKFEKYIPKDRAFANYVENYPYPYVIGGLCWEFPAQMPSDWDAQHLHQPNNPFTVEDLKSALDATVLKRGVFTLCFHPHNWIRNDQIVDLIDHAVATHGKRIKFLTFREAQDRIDQHLLAGHPIRNSQGGDNGVRLLDINADGYLDVAIGSESEKKTRIWSPSDNRWEESSFPMTLYSTSTSDSGARFGTLGKEQPTVLLASDESETSGWSWKEKSWEPAASLMAGIGMKATLDKGKDAGGRFRDLDGDGVCEFLISNSEQNAVFVWSKSGSVWKEAPFQFPEGVSIVDPQGRGAGLRFVDIDEDGYDDLIFSNEERYSLHLFKNMEEGWSRLVREGKHGEGHEIPMIARNGTNNGAWFLDREMWVNNEDTAVLPNHVERITYNKLLGDLKPEPRSPESSLHSLVTRKGFEIELVAAEPMVKDPINLDWGPDGKLWVVEMADYPNGMDNEGSPGGRVRYLEDRDRDGIYECSTLFLDQIKLPSSVMAWKNGVLVTGAPDLFYAEDTDGDGKADLQEPLYTGFGTWNAQHLVNGFAWGLDNWIYLANGDSDGDVESIKTGETVSVKGRDIRIRPEGGSVEDIPGKTQYGRSRDDWGNWFGCSNPNPLWHYALDDAYLSRNSQIPAPNFRINVSVTPGPSSVFPLSRTLSRFNDPWAANRFTSACSAILFRDTSLGEVFEGNSFVCEPVHNLVHREIVRPEGITFTSRRAPDETESEFLASSDNFCRPTSVRTGPDGALWVVDMYRAHIEHPAFIPESLQEGVNFRDGEEYGRIYRIYPAGKPPQPIPILSGLASESLIDFLDNPNGPLRDLAQRLLVEARNLSDIPLLRNFFETSVRPEGRLHALCVLDGLAGLDVQILLAGMSDPHPGVRHHAIRLAEPLLREKPELAKRILALAADPDPQVRLQVAYTLGEWENPLAAEGLGRIALSDGADPLIRAAVLSSIDQDNLEHTVDTLLAAIGSRPPQTEMIQNLVELSVAWSNQTALLSLARAIAPEQSVGEAEQWRLRALGGLLDALNRRGTSLGDFAMTAKADLAAMLGRLTPLFEAARSVVENASAPLADRVAATRLLGRGTEERPMDLELLRDLLSPQFPPDLRKASIDSLAALSDDAVPPLLIGAWKELNPDLRLAVLKSLLQKEGWIPPLLEALESGAIHPREIDAVHRQRLTGLENQELRSRANQIFEQSVSSDRAQVIEQHREAATLAGNPTSGSATFKKLCSTCHILGGVGKAIGPDLSALTDKSPEALLVHVLDPNRSVEPQYLSFIAETYLGDSHSGLLLRESDHSFALVESDGAEIDLLRDEVVSLRSSNLSFMPEGLELGLVPQDFADLFAFIASGQRPRKVIEGNLPKLVRPEPFRGEIWLMATDCEIYGDTLTFEKTFENLGEWRSSNDRAVWSLEVTEQNQPVVLVVDYAALSESAGNRFTVEIAGQRFSGTVEDTGGLDNYRRVSIGRLEPAPGTYKLSLSSAGTLRGELFNLRAVALQPAWMHGR